MIRKAIRTFLNERGYDIIKVPFKGKKYPAIETADLLFYKTPVGDYYLPKDAEKDGVADFMSRGILFDTEIIEVAKKYIKPGTAVLDVGANFGQMAVAFSKMTGPAGKVYAFEAQDYVYQVLQKNIAANNGANIKALDGAVYNKSGLVLIFPEPDLAGENPYGSNAINPTLSKGREVTTFTIDSLNIAEPVSFMKVDIQGSDLAALQGAKETIMKNRMPIIFEFEQQFQEQFGTTFQDYADFVAEIGYRFDEVYMNINYLILPR